MAIIKLGMVERGLLVHVPIVIEAANGIGYTIKNKAMSFFQTNCSYQDKHNCN